MWNSPVLHEKSTQFLIVPGSFLSTFIESLNVRTQRSAVPFELGWYGATRI